MTNDLQKELVQRLGELSGKPDTSKLHVHPVINAEREHGGGDNEISVISSEGAKKIQLHRYLSIVKTQSQRKQWHSDIIFEPIPSDYSLLRMTQLPKTGGGMTIPDTHPLLHTEFIDLTRDRHPLGLGLRALRPDLEAASQLPGHTNGLLRASLVLRTN